MNHYSTGADPYDAGAALGRALRADGLSPGQAHLPALSAEKRDFGEKSARICAAEYPSLLAEIRGLADGLKMPFSDLAAFLFGIYNFPPFQGYTCFAAQGEGGEVIFGRNSDFLTILEPYDASFHYTISGKHAFVGNSTAPVQIEDGVNEFGLAAGLTFLWPVVKKPGLNAGMLVRYLLEHCKTVREAIGALRELTISSSQTITLADRHGGMAVVECNAERFEVIIPRPGERFVAATNDFHSAGMREYSCPRADDLRSGLRYRVARAALQSRTRYDLSFAKDLLSGKFGFLCQYDRSLGADTVWSVVCLLRQGRIFRCEGNPSRDEWREDFRLNFAPPP